MTMDEYNKTVADIRKGTAKPYQPKPFKSPYQTFRDITRRLKAGKITQEEAEQEWHDYMIRNDQKKEW